MREAKLFDYVRITDKDNKHFGRVGQITDYDTWDKLWIVFFDKRDGSRIVQTGETPIKVRKEHVELASKYDLEEVG